MIPPKKPEIRYRPPTPLPLEAGNHRKLNDEPTIDEDLFGQATAAKRLANQLATVFPPAVIGLHGDWGSGKTSFLNRVHKVITDQNRLKPEKDPVPPPPRFEHCVVVWFEAWRYQHDETPVVALLNEIRAQFNWQIKFRKKISQAASIAFEAGLRSLDSLIGEIAQIAAVGKAGYFSNLRAASADWKKENLAFALPSQATRDLLNNAIKAAIDELGKNPKNYEPRLIIIVDDLDRCQPFTAYKFLEGIKIFLGIPSCVFLLGINREEILRSVAIGMKRDEGLDVHGSLDAEKKVMLRAHEYLEKLCGHIDYLPFPTKEQTANLVSHLLKTRPAQKLEDMSPDKQNIIRFLREFEFVLLPANPRRIKSFVNCLLDLLDKNPLPEKKEEPNGKPTDPEIVTVETATRSGIFIVIASLATFHPAIYRTLVANPSFFETLTKWCRADALLTKSERTLVASARLPLISGDDLKKLEGNFIEPDKNGRDFYLAEMPRLYADPTSPEIFRVRHILSQHAFQTLKPEAIIPYLPH